MVNEVNGIILPNLSNICPKTTGLPSRMLMTKMMTIKSVNFYTLL